MLKATDDSAIKAQQAAQELEVAAAHLRTAAKHLTDREIPRNAAHVLATRGHLVTALRVLDELAVTHASRSQIPPEDERP